MMILLYYDDYYLGLYISCHIIHFYEVVHLDGSIVTAILHV